MNLSAREGLGTALQVPSIVEAGIQPIAKSTVSDWGMPGEGAAYPDCGLIGFVGCLNVADHGSGLDGRGQGKAYIKAYRRSCGRRDCPKCHGSWSRLESERAEYRLREAKRLNSKQLGLGTGGSGVRRSVFRRPIHVVLSVDRAVNPDVNYAWLRQIAYKIGRKAGLKGGMMIFHPYRKNRDIGWVWSPHFHVVGYGWIEGSKDIHRATGWIVKNVGVRNSVRSTVAYQLSHCGVHDRRHTVTWFGLLAYNKLGIPVMPLKADPACPLCGGDLNPLMYVGSQDRPPPKREGEYFLDVHDWIFSGKLW